MNPTLTILCIVAGCASVIQGGLNRRIAELWGNAPAILINGLSLCVAAVLTIWLASRSDSPFAHLVGARPGAFTRPAWWYVLPGLLGFGFLMTLPGAIAKLGATNVFVLIVAGQLLAGLVWDRVVEGITPDSTRFIGVALVCAGAYVSTMRS